MSFLLKANQRITIERSKQQKQTATTTVQNKKSDNHAATELDQLIKLTRYIPIVTVILLEYGEGPLEKQKEAN